MLKGLHTKLAALFVGFAFVAVPIAMPAVAHAAADINNCLSEGSGLSVTSGADCTPADTAGGTTKINNLITDVINIFSAVVGVICVIMIIFGGFQYITSGGDTGKVGTAKTTIIYAIVGLIVVAFAQFIVQFVLNKVANTN
jgi:Type IV secretion system pilin